MFKTIENNSEGIIIEKKSKFIANVFYVESEEEVENALNSIRRKYYDAKHHCFAYRIYNDNCIIARQSDDGEPSGTAGAPMLNLLEKKELTNVLIVVTRYFGGTLLGTGGLVKAYSDASKKALNSTNEVIKVEGFIAEVILGYENLSEFEYLCEQQKIRIIEKEYLERIKLLIEISKEKYKKIVEKYSKNNYQNFTINISKKQYIIENK